MNPSPEEQSTERRGTLAELAPYLSLGWQLAMTIVAFLGMGYLIDRWLGTTPLFLMIGALFGLIGVFWQIVQVAREASRKQGEEEAPNQ